MSKYFKLKFGVLQEDFFRSFRIFQKAFKYTVGLYKNFKIYHMKIIENYIASVKTKRDWLIPGHTTSDQCHISLEQ